MRSVKEVIHQRASIRKFNRQPLEENDINTLLEAAMRAPTAGNMMLYSIIKITDSSTLKTLSQTCDNQAFIADAEMALIFVADYHKWDRLFHIEEVIPFSKKLGAPYEGPTLADFMLCVGDALIAAQNVVVQAEALGIGSCYIGDIMEAYEVHRELLRLPDYTFPAAMLVLGHYDHAPQPRPRFDKSCVVFDEVYHTLSDEEVKDMFQSKTQAFKAGEDETIKNFAQAFYKRKIGAPFFAEMNRSIQVALSHWSIHLKE